MIVGERVQVNGCSVIYSQSLQIALKKSPSMRVGTTIAHNDTRGLSLYL